MKERKAEAKGNAGRRTRSNESDSWPASGLKEIHQRAYEMFLARGGVAGQELNDWLRAAEELKDQSRNRNRPSILT